MRKKALDRFEKMLLKERQRTIDEINLLMAKIDNGEEINYYTTHPGDASSEEEGKITDTILVNNLTRKLKEVEDALERIKNGKYGICERCGREISEERLKALPYTKYCRECVEKEGI